MSRRALVLVLASVTFAILALVLSGNALAQTDPPALGDGDWTVRDTTVIRDWGVIMLRGDLKVTDGGDLTLSNSTMLFVNSEAGEHGLVVDNGASIHIIEGSTVGSSRPNVAWTFVVEDGCTLEIRDSSIEECGKPAFGLRPQWREIALYVGTSDAVVENTTFLGGLTGLYFAEGVLASPVRNCTFENAYGIVTWGTSVEDCTFHGQTIYGVVFHGGTEGRIVRSIFDGVFATCIQAGFEYFEPYELFIADLTIEDCTFVNSVRAIRILTGSNVSISDCDIDGMEREGIVAWEGARVHLLDGNIENSTNAILCSDGAWVDWDITGHSRVLRGNVTLAGNISLGDGAILDLIDIRNLTMWSHEGDPLTIDLGTGAILRMDSGSIEIPPESTIPHDFAPVELNGPLATVELSHVSVLNLSFPIDIQELLATNTTIPLGKWTLGRTELVDCELFVGSPLDDPSITITSGWADERSIMRRCTMVGADMGGPWASPWLVIEEGIVHSYDFLYDIEDLIENGAIDLTYGTDDSRLTIFWSWQAHVHWQNQMPISGTVVTVLNFVGNESIGTTGPDGYVRQASKVILTEVAYGDGTDFNFLPLVFWVNVSGINSKTIVIVVTTPLLVDIPVVDLTPPYLEVDQGLSVFTNVTELNLTGTASDPQSGVAFMEFAILPGKYSRVQIEPDTGMFRVHLDLPWRFQTVSLRVYDSVGNRVTKQVMVYYSTEAPFIFIDEPLEGSWVNSSLTFVVGQTELNATIEVQGRLQVAEDGFFRILVYLEEGPNMVQVNVTSLAGNHNTTTVMVYLDTLAPDLQMIYPPTTPYPTSQAGEAIRGLVEGGAAVFINSVSITVEEGGTFSNGVSLHQDANRFIIRAIDLAGNIDEIEVVFLLDSVPPTMVVLVDGDDATRYTGEGILRTDQATVTISVSTEMGAYLEIDGQSLQLDGREGSVVYDLSVGMNAIMVYVQDAAGNSQELGPIHIDVDRTPPVIDLPTPPDATEEVLLTLRGHTEPNVTLYVNGAPIPVDREGFFQKNFLLNEGINRLVIVAEDRYGQATNVTYDITMTPPEPLPMNTTPSSLPYMLAITALVLVVEAFVLWGWWKRKRAQAWQETDGD